jgi:oligopeptide transport system substrate-binding protein
VPERRNKLSVLKARPRRVSLICALAIAICFTSCSTIEKPVTSPYFAEVVTPPAKKEFRWSNGKLPRSFDPALAAAPPETDVIRAIYEGLTATDPRTLEAVPAAAEKWSVSEDGKTWRFQIRKDAVWSNGEPVKASDFVYAWNRLYQLDSKAAHPELLKNFAKIKQPAAKPSPTPWASDEPPPLIQKPTPSPQAEPSVKPAEEMVLDVKADGDNALVIKLEAPDVDLPKLLANPVFSPIFGDGSEFASADAQKAIVSNGPFHLSSVAKDAVVLDKSDTFRNKAAVNVDTVRIIPVDSPDEALEAYRSGRVDAVTNAEFEPLALKILSPYQDFRKVTHGALNLYEFNTSKAPYSDRRVREALSIAIERERLTEGEMEGSTRPALRLLPVGGRPVQEMVQDLVRAKDLLAGAGFPDGQGFPTIRLVVNRNDAQQRIARAVARMWKQNLGVDTEILTSEIADIDAVRRSGEFDLIRRGVVFASADPQANMSAIFEAHNTTPDTSAQPTALASPSPSAISRTPESEHASDHVRPPLFTSETEALDQFAAIPLYFPSSYSLVKPYIQGFEPNGLDIYSLQDVRIDSDWQPKRPVSES